MKKKSLLMTVVAFTALGLVGCNNKPTPTPSVSDQPATETPTSTVNTNDDKITRRGNTTFEVNQTATFRFNVTNATRNKLVNVEIDNPNVAAVSLTDGVDDHANNISNVKLLGIEPGTINRKVTSVETGNSKTFVLTVIAAKPTLKEALTALASAKNYTFTGAPEDESLKTDKNTIITKRNENSIIVSHADGSSVLSAAADVGETDTSIAGYARYGIAKKQDGSYYYLDKNIVYTDDNHQQTSVSSGFRSPAFQATLEGVGLLDSSNFAGCPDDLSAAWQTQFVIPSFSWIDPDWVSGNKADDNHYDIAGESPTVENNSITNRDAVNQAYLEYVLWNIVDPVGRQVNWALKGQANLFTFSSWINTSIDVLDSSTIKVTISAADGSGLKGYDGTSDYPTMVGIVSNVGNTTVESDFAEFIVGNPETILPGLSSDKKAVRNALDADSYLVTNYLTYSYIDSDKKKAYNELAYNIYYTKNYKIYEVPQESKNQYLADTGSAFGTDKNTSSFPDGKGYGRKADGSVYSISYTAGTTAEAAKITLGKKIVSTNGQAITVDSMTYFGEDGKIYTVGLGTLAYLSGFLHSFTAKQDTFWGGSIVPSGFSTSGKDAYDLFLGYLDGYTLDERYSDDFGLPTNFDPVVVRHADFENSVDTVVSGLSFYFGAIDRTAGSGYPSLFKTTISEFGTAKSTYDTLITSALAA